MDRYCVAEEGGRPDSALLLVNHERNNKVLPCPEGPVKWPVWKGKKQTNMSYRGVTHTLKPLFYPDVAGLRTRGEGVTKKNNRFGTSSMKTGSTVHRHLYHHFSCRRKGRCHCKTKSRKKLTKYAAQAVAKLAEMRLTVEDAEIPVISHSARLATRLDLVGTRWKGKKNARSAVVSIKTGYAFPGDRGEREEPFLRPPFEKVPNTFENQNQLQGACEVAMLRSDYGIEFDDYFVLYLGRGPSPIVERLKPWAKSEKTAKKMMQVLKTRFKKKK